MDYKTVLSSASHLKKNSLYKVTISDYTKEILLQLNAAISKAYEVGMTRIEYKLPINFKHIDNSVSNEEIQTAIYFNVIAELEQKEYSVNLHFAKTYTILYVSWAVKASTEEIDKMKKKLLSLSIRTGN